MDKNCLRRIQSRRKRGTLSLIASVTAVAVSEEEETIREREEADDASCKASILCLWRHLIVLCNINKLLRNMDHRW